MKKDILERAAALRSQAFDCLAKATEIETAVAEYKGFDVSLDGDEWVMGLVVQGCGILWSLEGRGDTAEEAANEVSGMVFSRAEFCGVALRSDWTVGGVSNEGTWNGKPVTWIEQLVFTAELDEADLEAIELLGFEITDLRPNVYQISKDILSKDQPTRTFQGIAA